MFRHLPTAAIPAALLVMFAPQLAAQVWSQTPVPAVPSPVARQLHGTAYDLARSRLVLFGGETATTAIQMLNDTWEFDGRAWTQLQPAIAPGVRWGHGMTYDLARGRVVVFGGCVGTASGAAVLDDTWEWDGANWTQLPFTTHPSARTAVGMVYDLAQARTLLLGGRTNTPQAIVYFADLWSYSGGAWTQLPTTGPSGRCAMGLAMDLAHNELVMFGGVNTATRGDTWTWDGANWTQRVVTGPSARWGSRMLFDPLTQRVLLQGGNTAPTQTWSWNGTAWALLDSSGPSRFNHALEFDSLSGRPTIVGGEGAGPTAPAQVWSFGTPIAGTFAAFGTGCSGALGVPVLTRTGSLPVIGGTLALRCTNAATFAAFAIGFGNTSWNGFPLPLDLTLVGMNGCTLYTAVDLQFLALASASAATMSTPIPFDYAIIGLPFYVQAAVADAAANAAGLVLSNAAAATIGRP